MGMGIPSADVDAPLNSVRQWRKLYHGIVVRRTIQPINGG
jgi:hypothetical protein